MQGRCSGDAVGGGRDALPLFEKPALSASAGLQRKACAEQSKMLTPREGHLEIVPVLCVAYTQLSFGGCVAV